MTTSFRVFSLGVIIALVLSACNLFTGASEADNPALQENPLPTPVPTLTMTVTYAIVDQTINYSYLVSNTGGAPVAGPVIVTDDKVPVSCPNVTTIGNLDANLDTDEALSCTGFYAITQTDLDAGSVTTLSTASASGSVSPGITTVVPVEQTRALTLSKTPDPLTFNSAGQTIIYTYVITNSGDVALGPAQFTVNDDKIGSAFNCGSGDATLAPGETISCSATYLTTEADLTTGSVTNNAIVTDGTTTSDIATSTINRGNTPTPSTLTPGSTIQHTVVSGEWLWQIARCYGADPKRVIAANSQLADPAEISPGITVTVPDIGSDRAIFGPQQGSDSILSCAPKYTIQSDDTWASIASNFTASPTLLQEVNPGVALSAGNVVRVPINSEGDT